jgi:hypothetical protein
LKTDAISSDHACGDANININYAYCGIEPGTNVPLLIFGVAEVDRAASTLEQAARIAAGT